MKLNQDFTMAVQTILFFQDRKGDKYVQAGEIAKSLGFSVGYLQKVIQSLSRHGIVECKRGRIGGVRMRATTVTLLDMWNVTCGEIDVDNPPIAELRKPLKTFAEAMGKVIIYKKTRK